MPVTEEGNGHVYPCFHIYVKTRGWILPTQKGTLTPFFSPEQSGPCERSNAEQANHAGRINTDYIFYGRCAVKMVSTSASYVADSFK